MLTFGRKCQHYPYSRLADSAVAPMRFTEKATRNIADIIEPRKTYTISLSILYAESFLIYIFCIALTS